MRRSIRAAVTIIVLALTTTAMTIATPGPVEASPVCPAPVVTGDQPGRYGSHHNNAFDGKENTYFSSSSDNWQWVQVDFGCVSTFSGLQRRMGYLKAFDRGLSVAFDGERQWQGETMSWSVDGRSWTFASHAATTGWQQYVPYSSARDAWHSVEYGWSDELELNVPVQARYVRFHWDGDGDFLHELDIDFDRAGPLRISLNCLPGEPVCTVNASGGNPGGYRFAWTATGVFGARQTDRSSSSSFIARCIPGTGFTVDVTVTDNHGRTASARKADRCVIPRL